MTNQSGSAIGIDSDGRTTGLKVVFGAIRNLGSASDPRTHTTVSTVAGSNGNAGHINGGVGTARFNSPQGVTVGQDGTVYVADTGNHMLRKVSGSTVTDFAGSTTSGNVPGDFTRSV